MPVTVDGVVTYNVCLFVFVCFLCVGGGGGGLDCDSLKRYL